MKAEKMKAVICRKSGSSKVLQVKEVEKPSPGNNEILVKVQASSVTRGDVNLRKIPRFILYPLGLLFGFKPMQITGVEFSGIVEETGKDVTLFNKGDSVYGTTTGLKYGANAEYVCVPEKWKMGVVEIKPENLSFDESAVIPVGGMTALHILKKGNIEKNQKVLIYGASGSVGSYAVQLAKHFGAEVTGVCSTKNLEIVKSLGADKVMDYTMEDFLKAATKYDVVFDAVGIFWKSNCEKVLEKNGKFLSIRYPTSEKTEYLVFLRELIEKGELKPFIDRSYSLDEVPEAHQYVESKRKRGNVVIKII